MIAVGRGLLLVLTCVIGLALGLGGFLTLGLTRVAPPTVAPAASPQDWEITLELSDAFLADRINNGGEGGGKNGGNEPPIKLNDATVESRDDGTVTIRGIVSSSRAGAAATPATGRPGPPIPLPINPPTGGSGPAIPADIVLRPGVKDGKLAIEVVRATLGPLPLPPNLGRILENPINMQLSTSVQNKPFRVLAVSVQQGKLFVRTTREQN
ncbi:MAG TPA: hypothetical protein VIL85_25595 [Thermomicrobiales bacterium]|jgi:hypothetical protein